MASGSQDRRLKSFIRIGETFLDIKRVFGFSFFRITNGYIGVQFITEEGHTMNLTMKDKNELSHFMLELETFIDDSIVLPNIKELIKHIENLPAAPTTYENEDSYTAKVNTPTVTDIDAEAKKEIAESIEEAACEIPLNIKLAESVHCLLDAKFAVSGLTEQQKDYLLMALLDESDKSLHSNK